MRLSSVRELKQELGEKQRRTFTAFGLGDDSAQEPAIAKGAMRLAPGPEGYGATIRVYKGKDRMAQELLKPYIRLGREVRVVRGVSYHPRGAVAHNMLTSGLSIGHPKITAGTLGGFVRDRGGVYILSNNHVLANVNKARANDPIMAPGPKDRRAGQSARVIGRLHRWLELLERTPEGLDAAIAKLPKGAAYRPSYVPGVGRVERTPFDEVFEVETVFKYGRTTKLTRGKVIAFDFDDVVVNYGTPDQPYWLRFDNQIEFVSSEPGKPFSQGGDSGSVIYDGSSRRPYALLFAGGGGKGGPDRTLGHFLPKVLEALGVEML